MSPQDALKTPPSRLQDALRGPKKLPGGPQVGPKTGFWEIFKPKMEPSWNQIRIQKRPYVKIALKQKCTIFVILFDDCFKFQGSKHE